MPTVTEILEGVAAGRIDPAEAARLLDAAQDPQAPPPPPPPTPPPPPPEGAAGAAPPRTPVVPEVSRLTLRATSRKVRLVGDPTVATVAVDGQHAVRREGSTLVVTAEGERFPADDAFTLLSTGRWRDVADRFGLGGDVRVRVRPDLPVDVEVIAGSLTVEGPTAVERVRVTAGSARVAGVTRPIDVLVQAGSATLEGVISHGSSRVRAESGSVTVTLLPGSDVRVRPEAQLGKVVTDPALHRGELVVGTGAAELDVEVVMGSATVRVAR